MNNNYTNKTFVVIRSAHRATHFKYNFPPPLRSIKPGAHQPQEHIDPTHIHSYNARTEGEMNGSLSECHAQGSKAPNTHFQPGYRLGRCGSRCTPSWYRQNGGAAAEIGGRRGKKLWVTERGEYENVFLCGAQLGFSPKNFIILFTLSVYE
jgi:hypothetical protein